MSHRTATRALGISPHTGWAACVVVAGTPSEPVIVANQVIRYAEGAERFCYHAAAEMDRAAAEQWLVEVQRNAVGRARAKLAPLCAQADVCAIAAPPWGRTQKLAALAAWSVL